MKFILLLFFMTITRLFLAAQPVIDLAGNTGYVIPTENEGPKTDIVFDKKKELPTGLLRIKACTIFYVRMPGKVNVSLIITKFINQ